MAMAAIAVSFRPLAMLLSTIFIRSSHPWNSCQGQGSMYLGRG